MVVLLVLLLGASAAYYMYNKPHRSAANEKGMSITAVQLCLDYETDEAAADKKYIGQLLEVSGIITELSNTQQDNTVVMLNGGATGGVQCTFSATENGLVKGTSITIKGFCNGYLMPDVKLDRCVLK
jgi:hypothetical protein